jgi:hypothetical protein
LISKYWKFILFTEIVCLPGNASANPIVPGFFLFDPKLFVSAFILTVIIEFSVIVLLLKTDHKLRLLRGVFFIHLITFPLTVVFAAVIFIFAEVIPITLELIYYDRMFRRLQEKGLIETAPSLGKIWAVAFATNMITFFLGIATVMLLHKPPF